jgi:glycolate oxidase
MGDYKEIDERDIAYFEGVLGNEGVITTNEVLIDYGHDETEDLNYPPSVLLKPHTSKEISKILSYCHQNEIPVTTIGARTGLSGGALSVYKGVGLSMENFNRILNIDENNLQVSVQPGVITQVLQEEVEKKGLFYAPDPASRGSCFIGGNLAENSGGPRALKYGVTKDFVLNLEVVLANGEIIHTGANTLKNSTGYNLTQLIIGSEGTLGVITEARLKLLSKPKFQLLLLVPFLEESAACDAVAEIFKSGITPSAIEFMEQEAIQYAIDFIGERPFEVKNDEKAHLLIELDGKFEDVLMREAEELFELLGNFPIGEILLAQSEAEKDKLWSLRRKVGEAVKAQSIYKEEDTVVPRYELANLLRGVKKIGATYGFKSVCYGHAGDGNLHINILKEDMDDAKWNNDLDKAIKEIFELTVSLGGTLSGEHGIGLVQKNYMNIAFSEAEIELMRSIKNVFDPKHIMNPGKILPDV